LQERIALRKAFAQCRFPADGYKPAVSIGETYEMLLDSDALELSGVVANSAMNRERVCVGKNSYAREISFDPLDFLTSRLETQGQAAWLDLCCGRGRALIEAAERLAPYSFNSNLKLLGIDLVAMFDSFSPAFYAELSIPWRG
jgi:hypothetical protein